MPAPEEAPITERGETDESLRVERVRSDQALIDDLAAIDETADEVIRRARARADRVLAAARSKADGPAAAVTAPEGKVERVRALEDGVLRRARADADEAMRQERAEAAETLRHERALNLRQLSSDREETNKDLLLERARADAALATRDEFLGIVSHDLRDLLNTIVLLAGRIAGESLEGPSAAHVGEHARRIQRAGLRMDRLIGDLMDVAVIEAGVLAVTREDSDVDAVVNEAVSLFEARASASGVALTVEIDAPLPAAAFDHARILQVLGNLLGNSIKFTPGGGAVHVHVGQVDSELEFCVSDAGRGIPADRLEAVFERFVQVGEHDRRGVGLGLHISKCIVTGHGGRIWAESTLGAGSIFRFTIPTTA